MDKSIFSKEIQPLNDGIYEVAGLPHGNYDAQAVQYDRLISSKLYNRLMWGNTPQDYADFNREGLARNREEVIADIGCGTLTFSADVYASVLPQNLYLCDLSYEMLRIGKTRIEHRCKGETNFTFLRADALNMPFVRESIDTLICIGFIHLLDDPAALIKEFRRILKRGGKLYLTSLCADRKFSARYLKFLYKKGHVSIPRRSSEIVQIVRENGFTELNSRVKGGIVYIVASV